MTSVAARPLHPELHCTTDITGTGHNATQCKFLRPQSRSAAPLPAGQLPLYAAMQAPGAGQGGEGRGGEEAVTGIKWAAEYYNAMLMMLYLPRSTTKQ